MATRVIGAAFAAIIGLGSVTAAQIDGDIVIKRKLTKRKVTASAVAYQRGVTVELAPEIDRDPLSFERSRVVIYLEGAGVSAPAAHQETVQQQNRRFVPDTLVVPAGSSVSFPNLDPIFHNVFSLAKTGSFDLGNYPKDQSRSVTFRKPGIVFVGCHLHPNMGAVIIVSPNQWCAKAAPDGRFSLTGVPPGHYTVVAWHKAAGFFRRSIEVREAGAARVQFVIPLEEIGATSTIARR